MRGEAARRTAGQVLRLGTPTNHRAYCHPQRGIRDNTDGTGRRKLPKIAGAGSTFNGSYTITGTIPFSTGTANILPAFNMQLNYWQFPQGYSFIQYAKTAANQNFRRVLPYGTMTGDDTKTATYANTPAINAAALMLAENIWTARFSTQNGGTSVDGYSPSPFKMSNTLMASIRGLLAPYLSPAAMVG